ncbi:hypothetical protein EAG_02563 [Camponotus floridanus]|uniref:Uncharacterized protein n=1 Tax=Camponotus floridanus TaxID=104421 RepID=E1ZZR9_CAMFO|nr:hypothetical protein EAG_02563 [Camponotus floridanus]
MVDRRHDIGLAWPGATRHDAAWHGMTWQGERQEGEGRVAAFSLVRKRSPLRDERIQARPRTDQASDLETESDASRIAFIECPKSPGPVEYFINYTLEALLHFRKKCFRQKLYGLKGGSSNSDNDLTLKSHLKVT